MNKRKSKAHSQQCDQKRTEDTISMKECIELLRGFEDFDVMRGFFDSGIEMLEVFSHIRRYGI